MTGRFMTATLFDPIQLGAISAKNRVIMSPLTRGRSTTGHVPMSDLKAEYYSQRASAGLIIAEATGISQEGLGWPSAPGVWNDTQVAAWQPVTEAVHEAGGRLDHYRYGKAKWIEGRNVAQVAGKRPKHGQPWL